MGRHKQPICPNCKKRNKAPKLRHCKECNKLIANAKYKNKQSTEWLHNKLEWHLSEIRILNTIIKKRN